jgi:phosphoribosylglycinamide formyltransferase 1
MSYCVAHKMRVAVGVSGGGRSLTNLLTGQDQAPYEVSLVFSSSVKAGANEVAKKANVPLLVEDFSANNRVSVTGAFYRALVDHKIDLVVLAGFLKLLPMDPSWPGKIINIHPALLPKYGGKGLHGHHVHDAVIAAKEEVSGATVHFVNERYDDGALIAQAIVTVHPEETAETLASKVFAAECKLLPWVIRQIARGALPKGRAVLYSGQGDLP